MGKAEKVASMGESDKAADMRSDAVTWFSTLTEKDLQSQASAQYRADEIQKQEGPLEPVEKQAMKWYSDLRGPQDNASQDESRAKSASAERVQSAISAFASLRHE